MKITRFQTITSIPNKMKLTEYIIPDKSFEPTIVDKSCYTPLSEQLKGLQPMTSSEAIQHFDFIDGKDDGREAPLRKGYDIAELSTSIQAKQASIASKIDSAQEIIKKEAEHKAMQDKVKAETSVKS